MKNYILWLNNLKSIWTNKDTRSLNEILSDNIEYFEKPFEKPFTTKSSIIDKWEQDLQNQEEIAFDYEIIHQDEKQCVTNWKASFTIGIEKYNYNGIFLIKLDDENRCIFFKQWTMRS